MAYEYDLETLRRKVRPVGLGGEGQSLVAYGRHIGSEAELEAIFPTQDALTRHHQRVEHLNAKAIEATPELRPENLFPGSVDEPHPDEPQAPEIDLNTATKEELQAEADRRGLILPGVVSKADLQDALSRPAPGRQKR